MTLSQFLQIMMACFMLVLLAAVIGIITFGIARSHGSAGHSAMGAGGIAFASTLTIGIAVFTFLIPLLM
ncbi:hypothetical protein [Streptomyces sp. NPDC000961]|uniref:hypothetical protein n=1 Tax=Streptomyces sp. NPDC000961 TaxID=3364541 RepID=UPI0036A56DD1